MIPVVYLLIVFLANIVLTYLALKVQADEHRLAIGALMSRNAVEFKAVTAPARHKPQPVNAIDDTTTIRPFGL